MALAGITRTTGWNNIDRSCRSLLTLNRNREYAVLCDMLALKTTDRVLDVGSGDGFWTKRLAKRCGEVVGVEPDAQLREYARQLNRAKNLTYVCAAAEHLPFEDHSFDKIISISCLEHFQDPFKGLQEMARVLKPGGRVALSVDSLLPENSDSEFREWHKRRHFVTRYFHERDLCDALQSVGLNCEFGRTVHVFRSRIAQSVRRRFIRRPIVWMPLFPISYSIVRCADSLFAQTHGQIVIMTASASSAESTHEKSCCNAGAMRSSQALMQ